MLLPRGQSEQSNITMHHITPIKMLASSEALMMDREIQVDTLAVQGPQDIVKEAESKIEVELKLQDQADEADNFYADIARQLALEIEEEENEAAQKQEEEKLKKANGINQEQDKNNQFQKHNKNRSEADLKLKAHVFSKIHLEEEKTIDPKSKRSHQIDNIDFNRDSIAKAAQENPSLKRFMSLDPKQDLRYDRYARLHQINSEKELLIQRLNECQQQIETLNSQYVVGGERNMAEASLHLAFLFATPLVLRKNGYRGQNQKENFQTMPLLEFKKEFKEIKSSLKETSRKIRLRYMQATVENLSFILAQNPVALHFSGHGIENNEKNFGKQYRLRMNEGNFLLFETEDGEGELVSERQLQEFINSSNTNLEFVFVASCYSEFAGKIFLNAGAKHVICVKQGQEIADQAVIAFSKAFYHSVFGQHMTICDSFKLAQKQVQVKFGNLESNKFSILKQSDKKKDATISKPRKIPGMPDIEDDEEFNIGLPASFNQEEHKCNKIGAFLKKGEIEHLDAQPRFKEIPAKVDNFIGRQKELFEVIHNIISNRLVNIIGLPGIGKSSLCKNAVNYIADRKFFKIGVVYMALKGYKNCDVFLKNLVTNFVLDNFELEEDEKKDVLERNVEQLLKMSIQFLKESEDNFLLVLDNVEDLLYHDKQAIRILINDLLTQCPTVHILMTSRTTLGALQDLQEKILVLQELSPFYTVELFISRSREIEENEIKELLECHSQNFILVGEASKLTQKVNNLAEHHLFKILGGNPHAIILAAPILIRMKLKELYNLLNSKEMYEVLKVDDIKDSTVASLRLSLEASIKILEGEDKRSLQFFFLIGMLPGGICEEELIQLNFPDYNQCLNKLENLSLISRKETPNEKTKLILPPFMNNYAEAKIKFFDKALFQQDICTYYAKICLDIYQINGKSYKDDKSLRQSVLTHQLVDRLLKHETNIWAAIYRMVETTIEVEQEEDQDTQPNDEVIIPQLSQTEQQRLRRFSTMALGNGIQVEELEKLQQSQTNIQEISDLGQTSPIKQKTLALTGKKQQKGGLPESSNGDHSDSKPFEVNEEQCSSQDDLPEFQYLPNVSQGTKSINKNLLFPKNTIREMNNESEGENKTETDSEDSFNEDSSCEGEDESPGKESQAFGNNSTSKDFTGDNKQRLTEIIRNSHVFRPSASIQGPISMVQSAEMEKKLYQRRQTMFKGIQSTQTIATKKPKVNSLQEAEKLVLYYGMNLYLLHENENALHLITEYALKANGSKIFQANIYRVMGLIWLHKVEIQQSIDSFSKADELFKQVDSKYGVALSKFSIGFLYRSKLSQLITKSTEDEVFIKAKVYLEEALVLFKDINHIVGMALSHGQLAHIHLKLGNKKDSSEHQKQSLHYNRQFNKYKNQKTCPHIQRVHGSEISLMTEIVKDNETKNMFPQSVSQSTSFTESKLKLKKEMSKSPGKSKNSDSSPLKIGNLNHQKSAPLQVEGFGTQSSMLSQGSSFSQLIQAEEDNDSNNQIRVDQLSPPDFKSYQSTETSDETSAQLTLLSKKTSTYNGQNPKIIKMVSKLEVVEEEDAEQYHSRPTFGSSKLQSQGTTI